MTDLFEVLSNPRRQKVVGLLAIASSSTLQVEEIARYIAQLEQDNPTVKETKHVRTSLRQTHLDRLEIVGAVSLDRDTITRGPTFDAALLTLANGLA